VGVEVTQYLFKGLLPEHIQGQIWGEGMGVKRPQKSHQSIRKCKKGCPRTGPHPKQSSYFIGLIVKILQCSDQGFVTVRSFYNFLPTFNIDLFIPKLPRLVSYLKYYVLA
jgi:hypothetical protein